MQIILYKLSGSNHVGNRIFTNASSTGQIPCAHQMDDNVLFYTQFEFYLQVDYLPGQVY